MGGELGSVFVLNGCRARPGFRYAFNRAFGTGIQVRSDPALRFARLWRASFVPGYIQSPLRGWEYEVAVFSRENSEREND
jgi:hypothetical protein